MNYGMGMIKLIYSGMLNSILRVLNILIGIKTWIGLSGSIFEILGRPIRILRKVSRYYKRAYRYSKGYSDTLGQRPSDTERNNFKKT